MYEGYHISAACLRYAVLFQYRGSFKDAVDSVQHQKTVIKGRKVSIWEPKKGKDITSESDLYQYIRNEFLFEGDSEVSEIKSGYTWHFKQESDDSPKGNHPIKEFLYFPTGIRKPKKPENKEDSEWELPEALTVKLTDVGLLLFRNGLGILWYELTVPLTRVTADQLMLFQNNIKELNRGQVARLWEKQSSEPDCGILIKEFGDHRQYITPFSFGNWAAEMLEFLHVEYFAERENAYASLVKSSMSGLKGLKNKIVSQESPVVAANPIAPDKAILFTYLSLEDSIHNPDDKEASAFVYHITNGYKTSYKFSDRIGQDMQRPFSNVYWYATQEGASYIAWPDADNREVFTNLIPGKIRTDYFTLFLKNLYQSYSLLIYADKIQKGLSAEKQELFSGSSDNNVTGLFMEINLFLAKSMATSVSNIHHQSEFYIYLNRRLRIQEDVSSVIAGLNALDVLQREHHQREEQKRIQQEWQEEQRRDQDEKKQREEIEDRQKKRDQKIQTAMSALALLSCISAITDGFDLIGVFLCNRGDVLESYPPVAHIIFAMLILIVVGVTVWTLVAIFKKDKDPDRKK